MKTIFYKLFFCTSLLFLFSCSKEDDNFTVVETRSIQFSPIIDTLSVSEVKAAYSTILQLVNAPAEEIQEILSKIKYDIVLAKVEYKDKDPFGVQKTLSGLVAYPILSEQDKNKELSVVSIQHGTLTLPTQAPTRIAERTLTIRDALGIISAAHEKGYISVQPDYFGYGSDQNNLHYYEHASSLAGATRKLIEYADNFARIENLNISNDKLLLFGYSEGGGATIATLKSLSENKSKFKNIITVAGAGAYDKPTTTKTILQQTTGDSPQFSASYAWVVLTYNSIYNINRTIDQLFSPVAAPEASKYTDNNNIMTTQSFPAAPTEVFNSNLRAGILDGTDTIFLNALKANDISDFKAEGKVHLVYGSKDTWVPTINTDILTNNLSKRGVDVTKTVIDGGTHATTYPFFAYIAAKALN